MEREENQVRNVDQGEREPGEECRPGRERRTREGPGEEPGEEGRPGTERRIR